MVSITNKNTHWIFICAIKSEIMPYHQPERHLLDVKYGIDTLINIGVPIANMSLLLDAPTITTPNHFIAHQELLKLINNIQPIPELSTVVDNCTAENIIICIYGHGSVYGIDSSYPLKPFNLVQILRTNIKLSSSIVIFGQCFSGIYNFSDLHISSEESNALICFLGASNLNSSISNPIIYDERTGNELKLAWAANIYMLFFFVWIGNKIIDIDGDGKMTLMDAYKYAGGKTSQNLLFAKEKNAYSLYQAQMRLKEIEDNYNSHKPLPAASSQEIEAFNSKYDLERKSALSAVEYLTNINHTIQDPWFLNANKAREIEFIL